MVPGNLDLQHIPDVTEDMTFQLQDIGQYYSYRVEHIVISILLHIKGRSQEVILHYLYLIIVLRRSDWYV